MDLKKLFEEISKLSVEEQKFCAECIECFLEASKISHEKGYIEEERIKWLFNLSLAVNGIIDLVSDKSEIHNSDNDFDNENQMKR